jgi:hypothetical protein
MSVVADVTNKHLTKKAHTNPATKRDFFMEKIQIYDFNRTKQTPTLWRSRTFVSDNKPITILFPYKPGNRSSNKNGVTHSERR